MLKISQKQNLLSWDNQT